MVRLLGAPLESVRDFISLGRLQSKMPILLSKVDQKWLETEFLIAFCRHTGDKWHSKTLFLSIFDPRSSVVDSVFDCCLPSELIWTLFSVIEPIVCCNTNNHDGSLCLYNTYMSCMFKHIMYIYKWRTDSLIILVVYRSSTILVPSSFVLQPLSASFILVATSMLQDGLLICKV